MATVIDGAELLITHLRANTAFMAAVTNRVYGPPGDIPAGISAPARFVCFLRQGGAGNINTPMAVESYMFHCYGDTTAGATAVYRALHDALQRPGTRRIAITGGTALLRNAVLESGPQDIPNPDTGWPRIVCTFSVVFGERILA